MVYRNGVETVKKLNFIFEEWQATTLAAEDFAFIAEAVPSAAFFVGHRSPEHSQGERTGIPHHNSKFEMDEAVLLRGTALYAKLAMDSLQRLSEKGKEEL